MSTGTTTFDVNRAIAILNTAKEKGMYPDPLPESDADKIMEAERTVALAKQAKMVADTAGATSVPNYDKVMAVLFEAEVVGGSEPERHPESATPAGVEGVEKNVNDLWTSEDGTVWHINRLLGENAEAFIDGKPDQPTIVPLHFLKSRIRAADSEQPSTSPPQQSSPSQPPSEDSASSSGDGQQPGETIDEPSSPPPVSDVPPSEQPPPQPSSSPEPAPTEYVSIEVSRQPTADTPIDDDEGDEQYRGLLDKAEVEFRRHHLPLPVDLSDPPTMPDDLTASGDLDVRKLHSQFNACAARAHYLFGLEKQKRIDCQRVLKQYMRPAMRDARKELGKEASVTEVTALAEEKSEKVSDWRARVDRHADREENLKTLYEIYTENVSVLSRDWTMRAENERGS
jgi:hypothetical protein